MKKILLLLITAIIAAPLYGMKSDTADIQNQIAPQHGPPSYTAQIIPASNITNSVPSMEQVEQSASSTKNYSLKSLAGVNCFGCFGRKQVSPATAPHNSATTNNTEDITIVLPKDHSSPPQEEVIHAFTVLGALSQVNAGTSAEHSGAPINQPDGSHAETRLRGTFSCDQYTCSKCIGTTSACLECGKEITRCCGGGTAFICVCLPATIGVIAASALDCVFLPCASIAYCCGDTDCDFPCGFSRTFCPAYFKFIVCDDSI